MTRSPATSASALSGFARSSRKFWASGSSTDADHAHLQLERLMPALRLVGEAIERGELKAVAPLIKVTDRLDKHQETVVAKYSYGPKERQRLLDKVNHLVDNRQPADGEAAELTGDGDENTFAEIPS
jgi:hypothetical protein